MGTIEMATVKYATTSPYAQQTPLHPSDHRQADYEARLQGPQAGRGNPTVKRIGLVLFGTGRQGFVHLGNIVGNPRVSLKYVIEADRTKWQATKENWNLENTTFLHPDDADKALSDQSVHAILVVTPTPTHCAIIDAGLSAGKHVFCEKPMAETEEGIRTCYAKADEVGRYLFCAFQRRFDPTFRDIFNRVRAGEIGKVQVIKASSRDSPLGPISYLKVSGGVFKDALVHDFDLLTWIVGELPTEVFVNGSNSFAEVAEIGDLDTTAVNFKFPSGAIAVIDHCRFAAYGYDQRIEIFGRTGMLSADNEQPNRAVLTSYTGRHTAPMLQTFMSRFAEAYRVELEHFIDVVQGYSEMLVTGKMTLAVAKICEACAESHKTGKKVVIAWADEEIPEGYVKI
eukprot:TRINITY_DN6744_c0_g1_i3.p1 TRINITY_DN6744_c0_g1~~TRINITY_DN6744_c0_g1_i3.p1  ORF type:complete len:421 (-),score=142.06 TRINITY_DN6744_c0_g1_i3:131-1324(-)